MTPLFIVHTEASLGWGGQEIRVLSEMAGMMQCGHRTLLLCPDAARIHGEAQRCGVPVEALPLGKKRWHAMRMLRERLQQLQPDILVTHSSTDSWLVALATRFWRKAPPIVRIRHISAPVGRNAVTRWLYGTAAAHVVTTGERLRSELMRDLCLPAHRITSVPTGIDLVRYTPCDKLVARRALGLPEDGIFVGIVATLRSWKGHRYLLDAWADLPRDATARLLVVGDGPGRENLRQQAATLGISEQFIMPGNQTDVAPWLAALDIFVLPSYANEGVPQALMQAMAMGLPVVSTPVGSIPEIVIDGATGVLVPPRDTAALRATLAELIADPQRRQHLGDSAGTHAHAQFSDARMLDRMETIFQNVMAKAPR